MTDDELREAACSTVGCTNYSSYQYTLCNTCLHGAPRKLDKDDAARKLQLEKADKLAERRRQINSDAYEDGYNTGVAWTETYRPGGPWQFNAKPDSTAEFKRKAKESQQRHRDWLMGFDAGLADKGKR